VDGDELVISGHKIWTTAAYDATHMFALVRTDPASTRQAGISFVLLEMNQPGVTVRPIRNIAGDIEFCEVFLDNARTAVANIVGPMHDGWRIAKSLLGFERVWAGSPRKALSALWRIEALARVPGNGLAGDHAFIDRLTQMQFDVQDLQSLYQRFAQLLRQGELGPEVSALKIWATESSQRASELLVEAAAATGGLQSDGAVGALDAFYDTRAPSIFSGTNQIQRNIIAKQVLTLGQT
jgi:alkylation response protein AidB-like acyl-CoA dehydrogenase